MKKIILFCAAFLVMLFSAVNAEAQQRTKIGEGIYLTTYGNVSVIEDDNAQMTLQIKVEKAGTNSVGETVYNVLCGNRLVKGLVKAGLTKGIQSALAASGIPLPSWAVGPIVSEIYDSVCEYFGEK
ncbi:MAG: hypothetical protein IKQ94_11115 [Bacteroidales bacterium]|nr:hypothetical protein [Bacteroidales bacterium]